MTKQPGDLTGQEADGMDSMMGDLDAARRFDDQLPPRTGSDSRSLLGTLPHPSGATHGQK